MAALHGSARDGTGRTKFVPRRAGGERRCSGYLRGGPGRAAGAERGRAGRGRRGARGRAAPPRPRSPAGVGARRLGAGGTRGGTAGSRCLSAPPAGTERDPWEPPARGCRSPAWLASPAPRKEPAGRPGSSAISSSAARVSCPPGCPTQGSPLGVLYAASPWWWSWSWSWCDGHDDDGGGGGARSPASLSLKHGVSQVTVCLGPTSCVIITPAFVNNRPLGVLLCNPALAAPVCLPHRWERQRRWLPRCPAFGQGAPT